MARPLRLEFPGALWHITSRGNGRGPIVRDDTDRQRLASVLEKTVETTGWRLHAFVLMDNHYHLLLETPEPNLSAGMRQVNGLYGQTFNRRHGRVGHVFQGRFKGILVEKEGHLLELSRYIVLNPVRAGLVPTAGAYRWSSYRATAGIEPAPWWLDDEWILQPFGSGRAEAQRRYCEFVAAGVHCASPWPSTAAIREGRGGPERMLVAYLGRRECGLRLRAIGAALSVDIGHVSHLAAAGDARAADDPRFARAANGVRDRLGRSRWSHPDKLTRQDKSLDPLTPGTA